MVTQNESSTFLTPGHFFPRDAWDYILATTTTHRDTMQGNPVQQLNLWPI